ncbi:ATP-grasp domain-containing protein [Candidatus Woesearchaeota archaeon]|nr:ATP-grasp domain-containing protein [Candidatus Woesearchaeota archaeon]
MKEAIYSNVEIRPDRAYILFVGDVKYIDTTTLLSRRLGGRYGKPAETINILPNMPPPCMKGNFIVVNNELMEHNRGRGFFLPLDQPEINSDVSNNRYVKKVIDDILKSQDCVYVNLFKSTREMTLPQQDERIKVIGPEPSLFHYFDNKINQRKAANKLGVPVPRGYICNSFEELVKKYQKEFEDDAFVTCAKGFGGNGTEKVSSLDEILGCRKLKGKKQFIISELLELESSPCTLGIIANKDEVRVVSIADQVMDGVNYGGTVYPSNAGKKHVEDMRRYTEKIGKYMGGKGYRGCFGVDFMIDKKGSLYFVEINPRKIGSTLESTLAHKTENPDEASIPELEFLAVTEGRFEGVYSMPNVNWGVLSIKAKEGQTTGNEIRADVRERQVFEDSGSAVLDHPGKGILYLADGRLAKAVSVNGSRDNILKTLYEEKGRVLIR